MFLGALNALEACRKKPVKKICSEDVKLLLRVPECIACITKSTQKRAFKFKIVVLMSWPTFFRYHPNLTAKLF